MNGEFLRPAKLTASDGSANDIVGVSVAMSGDTIVLGAPWARPRGAAYVFVRPADGWASATETAKLTPCDEAASEFGSSVSMCGGTIAVGAQWADEGRGSVYVFTKPPGGWADASQPAKLTASNGAQLDLLGSSVAVSVETVVAGARFANDGDGSAYVFVKPPTGWMGTLDETAELKVSDCAARAAFGSAVAIHADTVVVGTPGYAADPGDISGPGGAYVFVKPPSGWTRATQTAKLTASDAADGDKLGTAVAISGTTIVAGAPGGAPPAAYVFLSPEGGWTNATQTAKLTGFDIGCGASRTLGHSVTVEPCRIIAGAYGDDVAGNEYQGVAYIFVKPDEGWSDATQTINVTASGGSVDGFFGNAVAVWDHTVVVGAPGPPWESEIQGLAYVFVLP